MADLPLTHADGDERTLYVAIIEDDRTMRQGLVALIDGASGFRCVGAFRSVENALESPDAVVADVLLLDINLPGLSGSDGVPLLRARWSQTQVLMLTVQDDDETVFQSICNGAVGYLLKTTSAPQLLAAIREAFAGGAPMSPGVARKVVTRFRNVATPAASALGLTRQETRVLQLLADGHSYASVAAQMEISVNTVRMYIRVVYEKLHVQTRSEAVSQGYRRGLIR